MGTVTGITVGLDWSLVDNSLYNKCACYVQSSESDRVLITSLIHPDTKNCGISIKLENGDHSFSFDCSGGSYPSDVLQSHVMSISSVRKELPHGQYNIQYCLKVTSYQPGQQPVKVTCCAGNNTNCYSSITTMPSPQDTAIPTSTTPTTTGLTTTTTATSTTSVTITGSPPDTTGHQPPLPLPPTSNSSESPHTERTDNSPVGTASPSQLKVEIVAPAAVCAVVVCVVIVVAIICVRKRRAEKASDYTSSNDPPTISENNDVELENRHIYENSVKQKHFEMTESGELYAVVRRVGTDKNKNDTTTGERKSSSTLKQEPISKQECIACSPPETGDIYAQVQKKNTNSVNSQHAKPQLFKKPLVMAKPALPKPHLNNTNKSWQGESLYSDVSEICSPSTQHPDGLIYADLQFFNRAEADDTPELGLRVPDTEKTIYSEVHSEV